MRLHAPLTLSIVLLGGGSALAQEAPPRPGATRTPSEEIKLLPPEEVARLQPKREAPSDGKRLPQPDNPLDPNQPAKSAREPAKIKPAENAVIPAENEKKVLSKAERKARAEAKDAKDAKHATSDKSAKSAKAKEPAKVKPAENAAVPAENTGKAKPKDKQASAQPPARRAVPMVVDRMSSVQGPSYGPTLSTQPIPSAALPTTSVAPVAPVRPAVPRGPAIVNSCDAAGCTDTNGVRYNAGVGGTVIGPGGRACQNNGVTLQC